VTPDEIMQQAVVPDRAISDPSVNAQAFLVDALRDAITVAIRAAEIAALEWAAKCAEARYARRPHPATVEALKARGDRAMFQVCHQIADEIRAEIARRKKEVTP
jgi:hypothetical protein